MDIEACVPLTLLLMISFSPAPYFPCCCHGVVICVDVEGYESQNWPPNDPQSRATAQSVKFQTSCILENLDWCLNSCCGGSVSWSHIYLCWLESLCEDCLEQGLGSWWLASCCCTSESCSILWTLKSLLFLELSKVSALTTMYRSSSLHMLRTQ